MSLSLIQNNRSRINDVLGEINDKYQPKDGFVLVLDQHSTRIISCLFKLSDLLEKNIILVEKLELNRKVLHFIQPYKKLHAIYFIQNTEEAVNSLILDFQSEKKQLYKYAHVLFTNKIEKQFMQMIASQNVVKSIKSMKEFNLDYIVKEDFNFSLQTPNFLSEASKNATFEKVANQLFTLIPSMLKYFEFQIVYNQSPNKISERITKNLQKRQSIQLRIQEHLGYLNKSGSNILDPTSGKVTLLILDRSFDAIAPLIHDFHYQALVYDILEIDNDYIELKTNEKKNDKDTGQTSKQNLGQNAIFQKYKYDHIGVVMTKIPEETQQFILKNKAAQLQKGNLEKVEMKDLTNIVQSMPKYQETKNFYNSNQEVCKLIMNKIQEHSLKELTSLEQSLVTGIDSKGSILKEDKIMAQILDQLKSLTSEELKTRLALICFSALNLNEDNRSKITSLLTYEQQGLFHKMLYLGISQTEKQKNLLKITKEQMKYNKSRASQSELDLDNYTPSIQQICETFFKNGKMQNVNGIDFDSIAINENQSKKKQEQKGILGKLIKNNDEQSIHSQDKLVVFVAGGISYSEIRAIRQLGPQGTIFLGGTSILTPNVYIDDIRNIQLDI